MTSPFARSGSAGAEPVGAHAGTTAPVSDAAPSSGARSPATEAACAVLAELAALGVRHIVVSPGSRSQALALAADALERAGAIRMHVRIDERSAAFTALGIGRETGVPAVLVCTSGTAVANYLPAVLEAHHAGVPLLLLTADRPPELRGVGANQTTDQVGLFGAAARFAVDAPVPDGRADEAVGFRALAARAFAAAVGGDEAPGPAQLNMPFREPLAGPLPPGFAVRPSISDDDSAGHRPSRPAPTVLERGRRTVVLAGADAGPDAVRVARAGVWPLLAEAISGARTTADAIAAYRLALREPALGGRIERVVVFGHPTLNREETALLSRADADIVAVRRGGEALNLNGRSSAVFGVDVAPGEPDEEWVAAWRRWSAAHASPETPAPDAVPDALAREDLVRAVWAVSGPADRLMFGSSRLVRVADDVVPPRDIRVHANRGLAGIDGTVATGIGIALASQDGTGDAGVTRVLLGDLAFLHDVGSLLLPAAERAPRIQVVVGNDGGGTIFDGLEVAAVAGRAAMDRVQYTPQSVDLASLASAYGWEYARAGSPAALGEALARTDGMRLIEVPLAR